MSEFPDRSVRWAIVGIVVVAAGFVVLDVGGPLRSMVVGLAVFVAPGLAASLLIETMPLELRVVFAALVSVAIVAAVTTAATVLGSKSGEILFGIVGLVTILLLLVPGSRGILGLIGTAEGDEATHLGAMQPGPDDGERR